MDAFEDHPRRPRPNPARTVQMLDVARRFYLEMEPKVAIAEQLGISRYTVTRLLQEAKDAGYVRISIQPPAEVDYELSRKLAEHTSLERAIVLSAPDLASRSDFLSDAAASYLAEALTEDDVLGLVPGATTASILGRIPELPPCSIVQISGVSAKNASDIGPVDIVRQLSSLSRGLLYPLYAPFLLDTPELVNTLRTQIGIAESVAQFGSLTRALFTIGRWEPDASTLYRIADEDARRAARDAGALAEITGHLLNAEGEQVAEDLSSRCLCISYEQLMSVEDRVGIGRSNRKDAVLAALRAGLVSTLVTETDTAKHVLEHW